MSTIKYRPEIDGLRTLAVLSVIFYHISENLMPSGFVGVDVFLVVSGYLITSIISGALQNSSFSLVEFYIRRIKRIIPLTYVVLIGILSAGWFLSYPVTYRPEANSVLSALVFLGNVRFAIMGNYFTSAEDNPLLHLWSLSLEEQFYFIWPIFVGLLFKFKSRKVQSYLYTGLIIFAVVLATFFLSQDNLKQFAYFILPTRMTGLIFGALLSLYTHQSSKNALSITGLVLLVFSLFYINKSNFPGVSVLLPLLGTGLILISPKSWVSKNILSNKFTSYVGKLSFSLYMWHWPMLVFSRRCIERNSIVVNEVVYCLIFFVSLFLISILSYRYVESTFRNIKLNKKNVFLFMFLIPLGVISAISLYISKSNGVPSRFGLTEEMTRIETMECHSSLLKDYCLLNKGTKSTGALLVGDSHAGAASHFFRDLSKDLDITTYSATSGDCAFYSREFKSTQCEKVKSKIQNTLREKPVKVIVFAVCLDKLSKKQFQEYTQYIKAKEKEGYRTVVLKQVPRLWPEFLASGFMDKLLAGKIPQKTRKKSSKVSKMNPLLEVAFEGNRSIFLLDLSKLLCEEGECRILDEKGNPIYFDDNHLSAYGSEWLFREFKDTSDFNELTRFLRF